MVTECVVESTGDPGHGLSEPEPTIFLRNQEHQYKEVVNQSVLNKYTDRPPDRMYV